MNGCTNVIVHNINPIIIFGCTNVFIFCTNALPGFVLLRVGETDKLPR